jgi:hypothetical protein
MSDDMQCRYILATLDKTTGTHKLHNWPTLNLSGCVGVAQSIAPVAWNECRLIFKSHDDAGE